MSKRGHRQAIFWEKTENGNILCKLCPHNCSIIESSTGKCGVRENINGELIARSYGAVAAIALDPIEKKPLRMFEAGKNILSIGSLGCNLNCQFCQNYEISMAKSKEKLQSSPKLMPDDIAKLAKQYISEKNIGVAYTYNEPLIGYEFVYDCAKKIHEEGLKNILVTNGYISTQPLKELLPLIDAMNIDLKAFSEGFYKRVGGNLEAVKETIITAHVKCHVEITALIIPGENEDDIEDMARWLASIDPELPLHLSRFFPRYNYASETPTPKETILKLRDIAKKHLTNVFCGNVSIGI